MQTLSKAGFFGMYLVDYLPVLKYVPPWMPGASFKRQAREWRRLSRKMLDSPFRIVKQKKAQDDIDRVTGGARLPIFADQTSLHYISSIVWECLRWNPVAPMAVPHCVTEDDEYNGYRIPKGSTSLANVWYGG
jgi:hypothetical protein